VKKYESVNMWREYRVAWPDRKEEKRKDCEQVGPDVRSLRHLIGKLKA